MIALQNESMEMTRAGTTAAVFRIERIWSGWWRNQQPDSHNRVQWLVVLVAGVCIVVLLAACAKDENELLIAAYSGDTETVKELLARGVKVNHRADDGATALMMAVWQHHTDVVQLLLAHQADVNVHKNDGATALMIAAEAGHTDVVQLLLAHQADVNAQANAGQTALMYAEAQGHEEIVKALLAEEANVRGGGLAPVLLDAILNKDKAKRLTALRAMVDEMGLQAVPYLVAAYKESDEIMIDAVRATTRLGDAAVPILAKELRSQEDRFALSGCVMAIGSIGPTEVVVGDLLYVIAQGSKGRKVYPADHNARIVIRRMGNDAVPALNQALQNSDPDISGVAAALLEDIKVRL